MINTRLLTGLTFVFACAFPLQAQSHLGIPASQIVLMVYQHVASPSSNKWMIYQNGAWSSGGTNSWFTVPNGEKLVITDIDYWLWTNTTTSTTGQVFLDFTNSSGGGLSGAPGGHSYYFHVLTLTPNAVNPDANALDSIHYTGGMVIPGDTGLWLGGYAGSGATNLTVQAMGYYTTN